MSDTKAKSPVSITALCLCQENTALQTLYLSGNDVGDEGARYLAEALKETDRAWCWMLCFCLQVVVSDRYFDILRVV